MFAVRLQFHLYIIYFKEYLCPSINNGNNIILNSVYHRMNIITLHGTVSEISIGHTNQTVSS